MAKKRLGQPTLVVGGPYGVPETNTTFVAVEVPAGSYIPPYGVGVIVTTLLDGGTPSMTLGETDVDGWLTSADITETTVGAYSSVAAAHAITGRYYATSDTIDCALATGLTAGVFYVTALIYDVSGAI